MARGEAEHGWGGLLVLSEDGEQARDANLVRLERLELVGGEDADFGAEPWAGGGAHLLALVGPCGGDAENLLDLVIGDVE